MTLALTMGDPAGIGPEITAGAWRALREVGPAFVLLADPELIALYAPVRVVESVDTATFSTAIPVLPVRLDAPCQPGMPNPAHAPAVIASIERAVRMAQAGEVGGIVTNPINKAVLKSAGFAHPGHTEFLAALTGTAGGEVMMLASPELRVVPVTIHVSLRQALAKLSTEAIITVSRITHTAWRWPG